LVLKSIDEQPLGVFLEGRSSVKYMAWHMKMIIGGAVFEKCNWRIRSNLEVEK
jgi:hypothetical protein